MAALTPASASEGSVLARVVGAQKRGVALGIPSVCSAHALVLRAAFEQALADGSSVLVESTSNQVNQEGGYTGVTPAGFVEFVARLAAEAGLPAARVVLGGDHLGPHPWAALGARTRNGTGRADGAGLRVAPATQKIHLDASMRCADDPPGALADEVIAERTADAGRGGRGRRRRAAGGRAAARLRDRNRGPAAGGPGRRHEGPVPTRVEDAGAGSS